MDIEKIREYCLSKNGVTEGFPFTEDALVFKVMGKMFCLLNLVYPHWMNLKCDPEKILELREKYDEITPGYHMNKKHWNTINLTGTLDDDIIISLIDHSYELVVDKLPGKDKKKLQK